MLVPWYILFCEICMLSLALRLVVVPSPVDLLHSFETEKEQHHRKLAERGLQMASTRGCGGGCSRRRRPRLTSATLRIAHAQISNIPFEDRLLFKGRLLHRILRTAETLTPARIFNPAAFSIQEDCVVVWARSFSDVLRSIFLLALEPLPPCRDTAIRRIGPHCGGRCGRAPPSRPVLR